MSLQFTLKAETINNSFFELIEPLDKEIPMSMRLTPAQKEMISQSGGYSVLCHDNNKKVVGAACVVPYENSIGFRFPFNHELPTRGKCAYIFFMKIVEAHNKKGSNIRETIWRVILGKAKAEDYETVAAHIQILSDKCIGDFIPKIPIYTEMIRGFWPETSNPDVKLVVVKI